VLTIDTLRIQLPAGFEHRAERIGRLVGEALARIEPAASRALDRLALPAIAIAPTASDAEIAAGIADSVRHQLAAPRRQGDL
jgi:hypothetical protein